MITLPLPIKEVIDKIFNNTAYPVYILQTAEDITPMIAALTAPKLEIKTYHAPKIEEIRELINYLAVQPLYARSKVIIITNAEQMNLSSATALLKTLEEQKKYVFFILITANALKLLPTILSRAQLIKLNSLPPEQSQVIALASDLLELWSVNSLTHQIEIAEKWCKLYDANSLNLIWHCLYALIKVQTTQQTSSPILKKAAELMPNKALWAMFTKAQYALQIMASGITPNLQLLIEDLLLL